MDIETRLRRLERTNRVLWAMLLLAVCIASTGYAVAAGRGKNLKVDSVTTHALYVTNPYGKHGVTITTGDTGYATIGMTNPDGGGVLSLQSDPAGNATLCVAFHGVCRVLLGALVRGKSPEMTVELWDAEGKTVAYSSTGSSAQTSVLALLKYSGVKFKPVATGASPATYAAVMSGQVDVGWAGAPFGLEQLEKGAIRVVWKAKKRGYVNRMDTEALGRVVLELGGGRKKASDRVDPTVGLVFNRKLGSRVAAGDPLATAHLPTSLAPDALAAIERLFHDSVEIGGSRKPVPKLVLGVVKS